MLAPLCVALAIQPAPTTALPVPQRTELITYERPQEWRFQAALGVSNGKWIGTGSARARRGGQWSLDHVILAVPYVFRTAAAVADASPSYNELYYNTWDNTFVKGRDARRDPHSGTVAKWPAKYYFWQSGGPGVYTRVDAVYRADYVCYETVFDEAAAREIAWPEAWPDEARLWLQPEAYVSLQPDGSAFADPNAVGALLARWTGGRDPREVAPVELAKWLAGSVQEFVNLSGDSITDVRDLRDRGFSLRTHLVPNVRTAEQIVEDPTGSPLDLTVLLTAVLREAGLPARMVFGYQESEGLGRALSERRRLRSWVEFALFEESRDELTWVPVDVQRLREASNRMGRLDQPWKYFGSHDELDRVVPFAHHLVVPAKQPMPEWPGFVSLEGEPETPEHVLHHFDFNISNKPKRSGAE